VSGHFSFFFFYGVSMPYLALTLLPYDNARLAFRSILSPKSTFHFKLALLSLCYSVFLFGGLYTLTQTWSWGYHSMRQIIYGVAFGLASHLVLRKIFKQAASSSSARTLAVPTRLPANADEFQVLVEDFFPLSYLAIFNAVSVFLVILFTLSFPFNIYETIGFFVLWPSITYAFQYEPLHRSTSLVSLMMKSHVTLPLLVPASSTVTSILTAPLISQLWPSSLSLSCEYCARLGTTSTLMMMRTTTRINSFDPKPCDTSRHVSHKFLARCSTAGT
jgi:hypothetical protein